MTLSALLLLPLLSLPRFEAPGTAAVAQRSRIEAARQALRRGERDAEDNGKAAYAALVAGGSSGFGAVLGGGRSDGGEYARLEAHGFYWTAAEDAPGTAWYYNFGKGGLALHRQSEGEKQRAFSVRCVRQCDDWQPPRAHRRIAVWGLT